MERQAGYFMCYVSRKKIKMLPQAEENVSRGSYLKRVLGSLQHTFEGCETLSLNRVYKQNGKFIPHISFF